MADEKKVQTKIQKFLVSQGCYVVKVIAATKAGVPDLLVCYKGIFIGIEVKTPMSKHNTSKLQDYNLELIQEAGGYSLVAWDIPMVQEFLEELDELN